MKLDANQRNQYICDNINLVRHIIKQHNYFDGSNREDDLLSEGLIGLIRAVDTFDPKRKCKFATYAARCIRNQIVDYVRRESLFYGHIYNLAQDADSPNALNIPDTRSSSADDAIIAKLFCTHFLEQIASPTAKVILVASLGMRKGSQSVHILAKQYHLNEQAVYRLLRDLRAQFKKHYFEL